MTLQERQQHPSKRRAWTIEEDHLMVRQSQGEFSMLWLEREVHSHRECIIRRMEELGVKPIIHKRHGGRPPGGQVILPETFQPEPGDVTNFAPTVFFNNKNDQLLQQLIKHHDDRRYEDVDFAAMRKA
jgi:hypothetical protein